MKSKLTAIVEPYSTHPLPGGRMKLMIDLFSTDYGLMSLAVIVFILIMGAFFTRLFMGKMKHIATENLE